MPLHEPFQTTCWSLILEARDPAKAREALAELFQAYWPPLYAFIRHRGHDPETAADLTQAFCASLLESNDLARVDRSRGKFRAFLLAACTHFLANERDRKLARKRGGDRSIVSIDCVNAERSYSQEPTHRLTPEAIFARRWAITLLDQTFEDLRAEFTTREEIERFEVLKPTLTGDRVPSAELAARLNMTAGAVQVAVYRLRGRYRQALRARIASTVEDPSGVDDEIRDLFKALAS
jgi:RNA polymerase sigma factor (sigma-70 family)